MNSRTNGFSIFFAGAVLGSLLTWRYAKKKYAQIAQEEIESVKAVFAKKELSKEEEPLAAKADLAECAALLKKAGYVINPDEDGAAERKEGIPVINEPYIIPPEEFAEREDYDTISLIFYSDGKLADDNDELVEDVDATVGFESLNHFGEYEEDSVFVRNDRLRCDYEILRDQRTYAEAIRNSPHWRDYVNSGRN